MPFWLVYALLISPWLPPFSFCLFLPDFLHSPWGSMMYELGEGVDGIFQPVTFVLCAAEESSIYLLYCIHRPEVLVWMSWGFSSTRHHRTCWLQSMWIIPPKSCGYSKDMLTSVRLCTWVPRYHDARCLCRAQTGQCPSAQGLAKPQAALRHWFSYCTPVLSALHEFVFISLYLSVLKITRLNSENNMQM